MLSDEFGHLSQRLRNLMLGDAMNADLRQRKADWTELGHTTVSDNLQLEHYKFSVQLEH
jgi:hypothetical protein